MKTVSILLICLAGVVSPAMAAKVSFGGPHGPISVPQQPVEHCHHQCVGAALYNVCTGPFNSTQLLDNGGCLK